MNMKQAKQRILNQMYIRTNTEFCPSISIESYLVTGVKLGRITSVEAAKSVLDGIASSHTKVFNKFESNE